MFYMQYLAGLCERRQWPEPYYRPFFAGQGYKCVVRVNNREYHTDVAFHSEQLAIENAAQKAYAICRDFSKNDGMLPGTRPGTRRQGIPVAIGTERQSICSVGSSSSGSASSSGSRSGGSSPERADFPPYVTEPKPSRRSVAGHAFGNRRR